MCSSAARQDEISRMERKQERDKKEARLEERETEGKRHKAAISSEREGERETESDRQKKTERTRARTRETERKRTRKRPRKTLKRLPLWEIAKKEREKAVAGRVREKSEDRARERERMKQSVRENDTYMSESSLLCISTVWFYCVRCFGPIPTPVHPPSTLSAPPHSSVDELQLGSCPSTLRYSTYPFRLLTTTPPPSNGSWLDSTFLCTIYNNFVSGNTFDETSVTCFRSKSLRQKCNAASGGWPPIDVAWETRMTKPPEQRRQKNKKTVEKKTRHEKSTRNGKGTRRYGRTERRSKTIQNNR